MRLLIALLLTSWMMPFAIGQNASVPLNEQEKRHVIDLLDELGRCRVDLAGSREAYDRYISRETEQDAREKANADRALELEKQATAIAQRERDLAIDKANMYEQLYRSVSKKPGIGCKILKILSLGIHRCT